MKHLYNDLHNGIPTIDTNLSMKDKMGNLAVRIGFNRLEHKVKPGLYAIGHPSKADPLVVTCNYKLTFDLVRSALRDMNLWILILDTDGVNVWCAAGKGSFGSAELIYSLETHNVSTYITHKQIIVPQLGAPGIQSHLVNEITGFTVSYGPIYVEDLRAYILNDYELDDEKRRVSFNLWDRLKVSILEFAKGVRLFLAGAFISLILAGILPNLDISSSLKLVCFYFSTLITGTLLFPALLPYIPFRMFYKKGLILGVLFNISFLALTQWTSIFALGNGLISTALISYLALNFTGSTTFTSLSGVKKEMNEAIPFLIGLAIAAVVFTVVGLVLEVL